MSNQNIKKMETTYITPTKQNPVYIAQCTNFGYIERSLYKRWNINNLCGTTFALNYIDAVNELHDWIKFNEWCVKDYPSCKFLIYRIDGTLNKHKEHLEELVYSISAKKAKKLILG